MCCADNLCVLGYGGGLERGVPECEDWENFDTARQSVISAVQFMHTTLSDGFVIGRTRRRRSRSCFTLKCARSFSYSRTAC